MLRKEKPMLIKLPYGTVICVLSFLFTCQSRLVILETNEEKKWAIRDVFNLLSGDGISIKILSIPQVSKKVQRDAIYRKMESSKLSQSKRNLKLTSIAKSANSNLLLPTSTPPPSHFENTLLVRNIEIKIKQMLSFVYQNSVPNFNCPLVHTISCIENQIKLRYMQMS